ncbi:MAG: CHAT domain-containing protein [Acidobacteriota bacterium]
MRTEVMIAALLFTLLISGQASAGWLNESAMSDRLSRLLADQRAVVLSYELNEEQLIITLLGPDRTRVGRRGRMAERRRVVISGGRRVLATQVAAFHRLVAECDPGYQAQGRRLFDTLIRPFVGELSRWRVLCLIPDNILWDIPFQALIAPDGRHLLEMFPLFYAPSLARLQDLANLKSEPTGKVSLLSIGNPEPGESMLARLRLTDRDGSFAPLPEAELEARIISRLHGLHLSQVLTGKAASEAAVKRLAPGRGILHFATHGVLDNQNPLRSYLLLTDSETEPEEDGLLEAREILELDLQAELAILSACETARDWIGYGEGLIGLSGAFLSAGCRTVVVTQWKVDSRRTAQLVVNFFQSLKSGAPGKAEALHHAARQMMRNPATRHPYYWAAMIVVGWNK